MFFLSVIFYFRRSSAFYGLRAVSHPSLDFILPVIWTLGYQPSGDFRLPALYDFKVSCWILSTSFQLAIFYDWAWSSSAPACQCVIQIVVVLNSDDIVYGPDPLSPFIKNPIIGINSLINVLDFTPKYAILYACIFRCWIIVSIGVRIWLVCTNFFRRLCFSTFICVFFVRGFSIFQFANSKPSNSDFNFKLQLQTSIFGIGL